MGSLFSWHPTLNSPSSGEQINVSRPIQLRLHPHHSLLPTSHMVFSIPSFCGSMSWLNEALAVSVHSKFPCLTVQECTDLGLPGTDLGLPGRLCSTGNPVQECTSLVVRVTPGWCPAPCTAFPGVWDQHTGHCCPRAVLASLLCWASQAFYSCSHLW